jgi:hypothetical protein
MRVQCSFSFGSALQWEVDEFAFERGFADRFKIMRHIHVFQPWRLEEWPVSAQTPPAVNLNVAV